MNEAVQQAWQAFCAQPSESTFDTFYAGTSGFIYTICLRVLGDSEEASDVTQTVYSSLLTLAHSPEALAIEDIDDIVRRLALKHADTRRQSRRRLANRLAPAEELEMVAAETRCTRTALAQQEIHNAVRDALDKLAPESRELIQMQYDEGLTHEQIAQRVGRSRSRTTRLIQQATDELQMHLKRAGITESVVLVLIIFFGEKAVRAAAPLSAAKVYAAITSQPTAIAVTTSVATAQYLKFAALAKTKTGVAIGTMVAACIALFYIQQRQTAPPVPRAAVTNSAIVPRSASARMPARSQQVSALSSTVAANPASTTSTDTIAGTGQVQGTVVSRYTRDPILNVRVQAVDSQTSAIDPRFATITDANGLFRLSNVPPGHYEIQLNADSPWVAEKVPVVVVANEPATVGPIQMNRLGVISGAVLSESKEMPVPLAVVQAKDANLKVVTETKTDDGGRFVFTGLTLPYYTIYLPANEISKSVALTSGRDEAVIMRIGTASLSGTVRRNSMPLPKAFIRAHRSEESGYLCHTVLADNNGTFSLKDLPAGEWTVDVMPIDRRLIKQVATSIIYLTTSQVANWDPVVPSGELAGTALDEAGNKLAGLMVRAQPLADEEKLADIMPSNHLTSTTVNGEFRFAGLAPGKYTIAASEPNGRVASSLVTVPETGDIRADLQLSSQNVGSLQSTALSFNTEKPLPEAWCILTGPTGQISTPHKRGLDGILRIDGLQPGRYDLNVSAHGHTIATRELDIKPNEVTQTVDVLEEAGVFHWVVFDDAGIGKAGVQCRVEPADPNTALPGRTGFTDPDGNFDVRGLPPGKYVARANWGAKSTNVEIIINARATTVKRTRIPVNATAMNRSAVALATK